MTDLLREAEDELRRETVEKTAKRAFPFLIGAIVLALVGGAGLQVWRGQQAKALEKSSDDYYAAMDKLESGDLDGGIKALSEVAKSNNGMGQLALIQLADVQNEKGDYASALKSYDDAAKKISDKDLKALAKLRAAFVSTFVEDNAKTIARADEIVKDGTAFAPLARELKAGALWASGKADEAKKEYELLQIDPNAPKGLQARAGQAVAVINSGAAIAPDLMQMPQQQGTEGAGQAAARDPNAEYDKDGKRIVRLPPGQKLPPGTKIPPDVRVIETPLPAGGALPPGVTPQQIEAAKKSQAQARAEFMKEVEAQRQKSMKEQEAVTKAQQQEIDKVNKAAGNNTAGDTKTDSKQ